MGWALNDRAMIKSQASLPKSASCLDLLHAVSSPHMCTHMHMFKYVLWDGWRIMMTHAAFSFYMRQLIALKRWHSFSSRSLYKEKNNKKIVHIEFRNLCSGFSPLSRIARDLCESLCCYSRGSVVDGIWWVSHSCSGKHTSKLSRSLMIQGFKYYMHLSKVLVSVPQLCVW